jgi:hypothetical protein
VLAAGRRRRLLFLTLSLSALVVYLPRTYRSLAIIGDSAELVSAAARWGVPHPPGYPLYTLIAHTLTLLPFLELPWRVHLASACFHAATVGIVACIIELLTGSLAAALIGAVTLALGRIFFLGSLYAEVFPLNDLLLACLLLLAIGIAQRERIGDSDGPRWKVPAAVLGLSLAHHHMIVLAFPTLATLAGAPLWRDIRHRPRRMIGAVICALAPPTLFYALIPLAASRHPVPSWGDVRDGGSLWRLVTRQDYGGVAHASRRLVDGQLLERLDALALGTAQSFGVVGVLLFLVGALGLRRERRMCIALLLAIFCCGPLFAALNAFDIHSEYRVAFFERFTTMCHVPFAVMVGWGAAELERWLKAHALGSPQIARVAMGLVAALAVAPLLRNLASFDFSKNRRGEAYAHDLVESTPDGALVLLKSDMASQAALYFCSVERRCADRIVLTPGQLWMPWKKDELARRYPALSLPRDDVASAARWLVEENLPDRPVFVHPELVDDVTHGELSVLPSLLLFRVYPHEPALRSDLPRFRTELDDILQGRRCEGCSLATLVAPPTAADAQLAQLYRATLRAYATAAAQLEWNDEAKALLARLPKGR